VFEVSGMAGEAVRENEVLDRLADELFGVVAE
jgi:hypothetical protein